MADPASNTDYVTVVGPDKKTYRFPKGTDKAAAIGYFKRKGIGVAAPAGAGPTKAPGWPTVAPPSATPPAAAAAKPPEPGYFERVSAESSKRAQSEMGKAMGAESRYVSPLMRPVHGAESLAYDANAVASDILGGVTNLKNLAIAGTGLIHPLLPASYFGGQAVKEIPETMTRALHNPTPENFKQFYENLATLALAGAGAGETGGKFGPLGEKVKPTPEGLRTRAAELNTKVLKQAEAGAKDYKTASGLQVAQEGIVATMKSLPNKIEKVRAQKAQAVAQAAARADAAGVAIDVTPDVQPIVSEALRVMNQKGTLDTGTIKEIRSFLQQLSQQQGPQGPVPRNLRAMKPSDALALTSHDGLLSDTAQFTKARPDAVNNLARRIRYAMNQRVAEKVPDAMKLRSEESKLITARDAARENYAKILNDKSAMGFRFVYGSFGTIGTYLGLKALGVVPTAAIGSVIVLGTLAKSAPSRTLRAALYARAADLLDTQIKAQGAAGGAVGPSAGGSAITGPNAPTAPANAPNAGLTAPPAQLGPGAPAGGTAPGGTVGSAAGAALDTALFQRARAEKGPNASLSEVAQRAQELKLQHVAGTGQSVAQSNISSPAGAEPDVEMLRRLGTTEPPAPLRPKPAPDRLGTPEQERRMRESMVSREAAKKDLEKKGAAPAETSAKNKAMLDRLDTLFERRDKPKSGADRIAIQREIAEIRKVLEGNATPQELSKINKHIADRERLATKRAEAKPPETGTMAGGEAVAQGTSPEQHAITMDMGYKRLAQFDGGPEMVKALKKLAKDMSKVDPTYDEMTALTDAIMALKEAEGQ